MEIVKRKSWQQKILYFNEPQQIVNMSGGVGDGRLSPEAIALLWL